MLLSNRNKSINLLYRQINWILRTGKTGLNKVNEADFHSYIDWDRFVFFIGIFEVFLLFVSKIFLSALHVSFLKSRNKSLTNYENYVKKSHSSRKVCQLSYCKVEPYLRDYGMPGY